MDGKHRHASKLRAMFVIAVCVMSCVRGDESRTMKAPCSPGYFLCNNSPICVEQRYNCDGTPDCPDESDEQDCEDERKLQYWNKLFRKRPDEDREKKATSKCYMVKTPEDCSCSMNNVFCEHRQLLEVPRLPIQTQVLDLSGNSLMRISSANFSELPVLKTLILTSTAIQNIEPRTFASMKTLKSLYLTSNELTLVRKDTFANNLKLKLLVLSHNPITRIELGAFKDLGNLSELDLRDCAITDLEVGVFDTLTSLKILWLDGNQLQEISHYLFAKLSHLETLSITKNSIHTIGTQSFAGLTGLHSLSLSVNNMSRLSNFTFENLNSLLKLDIRSNKLRALEPKAFATLSKIESLDLRDNPFRKLPPNLFDELTSLTHIYFDEFRLCSYALHVRVCEPRGDGISSFQHLLDNVVLRVSVWVVALLACVGNIFVLIGRMLMQELNEVHSFFIKNLALADLLMGVYLFIIAYYDVSFRGEYIRHEESWRHSWQCNLSGSLSTLSSEASVFILTVITVDRYLSVSYPFSLKKRTKTFAVGCMIFVWSSALFLATLPLLDTELFGDEFYGNNGVCLALQIHDPYSTAWEYSAFLFCGINLVAFIFVTYAYVKMSLTIASSKVGLRTTQQQQDGNIAKRFGFIVGTDCFCWMPIVIIKILALAGVPINDDLYAWVAVFLLPVNSALNPILYTLTTKLFKQHLAKIMGSATRRHGSPTQHDHNSEQPHHVEYKTYFTGLRYSLQGPGELLPPKISIDGYAAHRHL